MEAYLAFSSPKRGSLSSSWGQVSVSQHRQVGHLSHHRHWSKVLHLIKSLCVGGSVEGYGDIVGLLVLRSPSVLVTLLHSKGVDHHDCGTHKQPGGCTNQMQGLVLVLDPKAEQLGLGRGQLSNWVASILTDCLANVCNGIFVKLRPGLFVLEHLHIVQCSCGRGHKTKHALIPCNTILVSVFVGVHGHCAGSNCGVKVRITAGRGGHIMIAWSLRLSWSFLHHLLYRFKGLDELKRFGQGGQHIRVEDVMALARKVPCKSPTPIWSWL